MKVKNVELPSEIKYKYETDRILFCLIKKLNFVEKCYI